jgi:hypothetical protein
VGYEQPTACFATIRNRREKSIGRLLTRTAILNEGNRLISSTDGRRKSNPRCNKATQVLLHRSFDD